MNDLVRVLGLPQPQVSKHLRVLREVGAVEVRDQGRQRLYRLNGRALKPITTGSATTSARGRSGSASWTSCCRNSSTRREMAAVTSGRPAKVTLPTDEQILITREFDAPRHLVYEAWTTPELVRRWWSGTRGEMTAVEIDLRVGGKWRYVMATEGGGEVAFHGEYREIVPNQRIVYTEVFEGTPDAQALTAVTFTEAAGQTTLAILIRYDSGQDRDAHSTYMQDGLQEALDLLGRTAKALATRPRSPEGKALPQGR